MAKVCLDLDRLDGRLDVDLYEMGGLIAKTNSHRLRSIRCAHQHSAPIGAVHLVSGVVADGQ